LTVLDLIRSNIRVEVRGSDAALLLPIARRLDFRVQCGPALVEQRR
jgi:hypothetical protein